MFRNSVLTALTVLVPSLLARQVPVTTPNGLMTAMKTAVAGDTILVAPGTYTGEIALSGDPGNLPNGTGYFWVGNNGTAQHPIVIIAADPAHPPVLQGSTISSGYVVHVTGDYVVLKSLVITQGDKGVIFDNASNGILEDCEVYNVGAELIHVRDASSNVIISRNNIHNSGNTAGTYGEGLYIGTDFARWGADDVAQTATIAPYWGPEGIAEGYGGYDWRVQNTQVMCNFFSGGISAECIDSKEGTQNTTVIGNVFVADSIGKKAGANFYDDSFIDQKGVKGVFTGNTFFLGGNTITTYIAEVLRSFPNVPSNLTAEKHAKPWCDNILANDSNNCSAANNTVVTSSPADPRSACTSYFDMNWSALNSTPISGNRPIRPLSARPLTGYDLLGRTSH